MHSMCAVAAELGALVQRPAVVDAADRAPGGAVPVT